MENKICNLVYQLRSIHYFSIKHYESAASKQIENTWYLLFKKSIFNINLWKIRIEKLLFHFQLNFFWIANSLLRKYNGDGLSNLKEIVNNFF